MARIRSMRLCAPAPSLNINGFAVHRLQLRMQYADFANESRTEAIYCSELEDQIMRLTGAKNVRVHDYQVDQSLSLSLRLTHATPVAAQTETPSFPYFQGNSPLDCLLPSLVSHVSTMAPILEEVISLLPFSTPTFFGSHIRCGQEGCSTAVWGYSRADPTVEVSDYQVSLCPPLSPSHHIPQISEAGYNRQCLEVVSLPGPPLAFSNMPCNQPRSEQPHPRGYIHPNYLAENFTVFHYPNQRWY